jgi:hypothetical protein
LDRHRMPLNPRSILGNTYMLCLCAALSRMEPRICDNKQRFDYSQKMGDAHND